MTNIRTIALVSLTAFVLILLFQNLQTAVVHFFFWDISMPLIILIFVVLLAAFTSGYLVAMIQSKKGATARRDDNEPGE